MPTGTFSIGDILRQFESLLASGFSANDGNEAFLRVGLPGIVNKTADNSRPMEIAENLTQGLFGGTLGVVAGLFGSLFRKTNDPPPLFTTFEKPGSMLLQHDVSASPSGSGLVTLHAANSVGGESAPAQRVAAVPPSVVIQVNAMDAHSFSSRSGDIASAVREALTRNHALRDEIWED